MKKNLVLASAAALLLMASCKTSTTFSGNYGQVNQTQVVLASDNFKVLGSYSGTASEKIEQIGIKKQEGLIAQAKMRMLEKAKSGGAELKGSRALVNVVVDVVSNENRVTATVCADVVEFVK